MAYGSSTPFSPIAPSAAHTLARTAGGRNRAPRFFASCKVQKTEVQLGVPQVALQPLIVRWAFARRAAVRHPLAVLHALQLQAKIGGCLLKRHGGTGFDARGCRWISKAGAKGQPQKQRPGDHAHQPRLPPQPPGILKRKSVQRAGDEERQVLEHLRGGPVSERPHVPRRGARANAIDLVGQVGERLQVNRSSGRHTGCIDHVRLASIQSVTGSARGRGGQSPPYSSTMQPPSQTPAKIAYRESRFPMLRCCSGALALCLVAASLPAAENDLAAALAKIRAVQ